MTYYCVNLDYKGDRFIPNELYTEKELIRLGYDMEKVKRGTLFHKREIKKTEIYWFFGARFKDGENHAGKLEDYGAYLESIGL